MGLDEYIKGERFGEDAYELEKEAMGDPFLQDAIDGYDIDDYGTLSNLKNLQSQIRKRTKTAKNYLQLGFIILGILVIICLSVIFFLSDPGNKTEFQGTSNSGTIYTDESDNLANIIDSLNALKVLQAGIDSTLITEDLMIAEADPQPDALITTRENPTIQPATERRLEAAQDNLRNRTRAQSDNNSLSDSEMRRLISEYTYPVETPKVAAQPAQTPQPTVGDKAYKDYINYNRNLVADDMNETCQGKVILVFKVNKQGRPFDIAVLRSLNQSADKEAVRLLQNGPDWTVSNVSSRLEVDF